MTDTESALHLTCCLLHQYSHQLASFSFRKTRSFGISSMLSSSLIQSWARQHLKTKQNENFVKLWHWNHSVFLKDAGRKFTKLIKEPQIIPIYNLGRGHVTMVMKYGCVFENKMFKFLTEWGAILSPLWEIIQEKMQYNWNIHWLNIRSCGLKNTQVPLPNTHTPGFITKVNRNYTYPSPILSVLAFVNVTSPAPRNKSFRSWNRM